VGANPPAPEEVMTAASRKRPNPRAKPARKQAAPSSKLDQIVGALTTRTGATIPDLVSLTGWQSHSVRGALSGALKKQRGLIIRSEKVGEERRYKIAKS